MELGRCQKHACCLIEVASPYESRDDGMWHHAPNKFAYRGPGEHSSHAEIAIAAE